MKRVALLLVLAVLVLLLAAALPLPVPASMGGMALCPECLPSELHAGLALCLGLFAAFVLLLPRFGSTRVVSLSRSRGLSLSSPPEHPPRSR